MRAAVLLLLAACGDGPMATPPVDARAADALPLPRALPAHLAETGLYADLATKQLAADLLPYAPTSALWSDGAEKHRWLALPPGGQVDTSDLDHWRFPVGTRAFKEFVRDGKRLETRVLWRVGDSGDREADTLLGSYLWNDDESDAVYVPAGATDVRGTDHDVPAAAVCWRCHLGERGHVLGFSAVQLGDLTGLPLSAPPPAGATFGAPSAALGYLHANCGHCHNPDGGAWADSRMVLRLGAGEREPQATAAYATTVNAPLEQWIGRGYTYRIVPGAPEQSALLYRTMQRAPNVQMPPLATEHPDDAGLATLRQWIESL